MALNKIDVTTLPVMVLRNGVSLDTQVIVEAFEYLYSSYSMSKRCYYSTRLHTFLDWQDTLNFTRRIVLKERERGYIDVIFDQEEDGGYYVTVYPSSDGTYEIGYDEYGIYEYKFIYSVLTPAINGNRLHKIVSALKIFFSLIRA